MRIIKQILKWILAVTFILAGINHFLNPQFYLKMMPPVLPSHLLLIYTSGFFEITLGVLLLISKYQKLAAWGLVALLIAVFPANIYMAMNQQLFPEFGRTALFLRLILQFILIAMVFWIARKRLD
jgi:uncharacterized membrane protein